ncbi:MAG: alpha/beta hydrolase [Deltaproteobacteria bacterium]
MSEILLNGNRIHYISDSEIDRSRATVLMIHGAGQRSATWRFQIDLLGKTPGFNFIAPDLPGHGKSGGEGHRSVDGYKEFIEEFAGTLGLDDLILVGHSMGGGAAMLFALEHAEKVRACVLVDTGARLRVAEETLKAVKNNYRLFCDISPTRAFAENSSEELKKEFREGLLNTSQDVCYWDLVACDEFDITARVGEIGVPALIVSGSEDILTPVKYGEYLNKNIKGSSFKVIEKAGHFVMQESPEEFNRVLISFISALK